MNVRDYIKAHEGFSYKIYLCPTGYPTIGWGHKLLDHEKELYKDGITDEAAEELLTADIAAAEQDARNLFRNFNELTENRQGVLIDMAFNLGWHGLSKFKKFRLAVQAEDWQHAAKEILLSKYAKQVGRRATENATNMLGG